MKRYLTKRLGVSLLLMMLVAVLVMCVIGMSPQPAEAKGPCEVAAEFGGHSTFWNMLCYIELLFDYMFIHGDL